MKVTHGAIRANSGLVGAGVTTDTEQPGVIGFEVDYFGVKKSIDLSADSAERLARALCQAVRAVTVEASS